MTAMTVSDELVATEPLASESAITVIYLVAGSGKSSLIAESLAFAGTAIDLVPAFASEPLKRCLPPGSGGCGWLSAHAREGRLPPITPTIQRTLQSKRRSPGRSGRVRLALDLTPEVSRAT